MNDELSQHGLFFDYLYNIRVLNPNVVNETEELKEKSGEYSESKKRQKFISPKKKIIK